MFSKCSLGKFYLGAIKVYLSLSSQCSPQPSVRLQFFLCLYRLIWVLWFCFRLQKALGVYPAAGHGFLPLSNLFWLFPGSCSFQILRKHPAFETAFFLRVWWYPHPACWWTSQYFWSGVHRGNLWVVEAIDLNGPRSRPWSDQNPLFLRHWTLLINADSVSTLWRKNNGRKN